MYTIVTVSAQPNGVMQLECLGPFDTKKEAEQYTRRISYKCLMFVELLQGK